MYKIIYIAVSFYFFSISAQAAPGQIILGWLPNTIWSTSVSIDVPWSGKKTIISLPAQLVTSAQLVERQCSETYPLGSTFGFRKAAMWMNSQLSATVAGESVTITPLTGNGWNLSHVSDWLINTYKDETGHFDGDCVSFSTDPASLRGPFTAPRLELDIPRNLPAGRHSFSFVVKMGIEEQLATNSGYVIAFPSRFLTSFRSQNVTVNLDIQNSCTVSVHDINIDHGRLNPAQAHRNEKISNFSVNCTSPAQVKLRLLSNNSPNIARPSEGVGVGLGNGWDSYLSIDGISSGDFTTHVDSSKSFSLSSRLLNSDNQSKEGSLSGSAILLVSPL